MEKRFDEVLLYHVRRFVPGLLPEDKRPIVPRIPTGTSGKIQCRFRSP